MFKVSIHNQILQILNCLNTHLLSECQAFFGGGTQIVMSYGEYRMSRDIDFLCPYGSGYSQLRRALFDHGYSALFVQQTEISLPRSFQADQYGVRFPVEISGTVIKFEVVAEGRIDLGQPQQLPWCPVMCLGFVDQVAEKLLANSDRWLDTSVWSRDLIDLAVLRKIYNAPLPEVAFEKSEAAYPVRRPLVRAIQQFQDSPDYRARCFDQLAIISPPSIIDGLDLLAGDLNLEPIHRNSRELT